MKKGLPIRWKIFTYLLCFCAALLLLLWLFQVVFLDAFYRGVKISQMKSAAAELLPLENREDLMERMNQIAQNTMFYSEVVDDEGQVVASMVQPATESILQKMSVRGKKNLTDLAEQAPMMRYAEEKGGRLYLYDVGKIGNQMPDVVELSPRRDGWEEHMWGSRSNKSDGKSAFFNEKEPHFGRSKPAMILYALPFRDGTMLLMTGMVAPVTATVEALKIQLLWITGVMIGFSVLIAWILSRNVSTPIKSICGQADILAKGNYDVTFPVGGYREIGQLSETLTQMARDLSKVEQLRRELIANVSHDLRTPLTLIEGYAEAMRDLPGENNPTNCQIILDETKRLSTLVADTLQLSKLQAGAAALSMERFDLIELILDEINRLQRLVKKDGYRIVYEGAQEQLYVNADKNSIRQAFYNLLINGINYTGADKTVLVSVTEQNQKVQVQVIDSGEGIEEAELPFIWERYYKSGKNHKRSVTGTGLGLSIVKGVFQRHSCEYGVTSTLGKGSTFWFALDSAKS